MPRSPSPASSSLPIVTFLSDFGTRDHYVAAMKAAVLRYCDRARLIDITHETPRHDILCGSITLERAVDGFPPGTIHVAVVDPGVGTSRRILLTQINRQLVVCPDNGLITWTQRRLGPGQSGELLWRPPRPPSNTFHGRDIMAPAAGLLAAGATPDSLSRPLHDPVLLDIFPAEATATRARVIQIDHFGNATTNFGVEGIARLEGKIIRVGRRVVGKLRRTYHDVAPGKPLALLGSSGLLEIAVRDGSAARTLKLKVGDEVRLE